MSDRKSRPLPRHPLGDDFVADDRLVRFGPAGPAQLVARLTAFRLDPRDSVAAVSDDELAQFLRSIADADELTLPRVIVLHLRDILQRSVPSARGRPASFTPTEMLHAKSDYDWLFPQLQVLHRSGDLATWCREEDVKQGLSPSETAANAIAQWCLPCMSGKALLNAFTKLPRSNRD